MLVLHARHVLRVRRGRQQEGGDGEQLGDAHAMLRKNAWFGGEADHIVTIQTAIAIMPRFSVSETNPSGTLDAPPTQAHFSLRLSR